MKMTREQTQYAQQRIYETAESARLRVKRDHRVEPNPLTWVKFWELVDSGEIAEPDFRKETSLSKYPHIHADDLLTDDLRRRFHNAPRTTEAGQVLLDQIDAAEEKAMDDLMLGDGAKAISDLLAALAAIK